MILHCTLTQWFGANLNNSYAKGGLKGHTGIDEVCGFKTNIRPYVSGMVYALFTPEKPSYDGYTGVYILCETDLELAELSYGHVSEVLCKIGDKVTTDTVIAKEGNKGTVFTGGTQITLEMQKNGDTRGHHRHVQWRPVTKTKVLNLENRYLTNESGFYTDTDGNYYQVYDRDNGYWGCADLAASLWPRNLYLTSRGYDVMLLQKALAREGFFIYPEYTGYFGTVTLRALREAQLSRGISPALGYFGPKSRAVYNLLYPRVR